MTELQIRTILQNMVIIELLKRDDPQITQISQMKKIKDKICVICLICGFELKYYTSSYGRLNLWTRRSH